MNMIPLLIVGYVIFFVFIICLLNIGSEYDDQLEELYREQLENELERRD